MLRRRKKSKLLWRLWASRWPLKFATRPEHKDPRWLPSRPGAPAVAHRGGAETIKGGRVCTFRQTHMNARDTAQAVIQFCRSTACWRTEHSHAHAASGTYHDSQGLKSGNSTPAKSFTLRVTRVKSCSRAVAAIMPSILARVIPLRGT